MHVTLQLTGYIWLQETLANGVLFPLAKCFAKNGASDIKEKRSVVLGPAVSSVCPRAAAGVLGDGRRESSAQHRGGESQG